MDAQWRQQQRIHTSEWRLVRGWFELWVYCRWHFTINYSWPLILYWSGSNGDLLLRSRIKWYEPDIKFSGTPNLNYLHTVRGGNYTATSFQPKLCWCAAGCKITLSIGSVSVSAKETGGWVGGVVEVAGCHRCDEAFGVSAGELHSALWHKCV